MEPIPIVLTANQTFVAQVYLDLLHRKYDSPGLAFWSGLLDQNVSRAQVVRMIENSAEYRTVVVQGLYNSYLHRGADPQGLSGFVGFLSAGGTIEQVKAAILTSPEYFQTSGGGTNAGFVASLYQNVLDRTADAAGLAHFSQLLNLGVSMNTVPFDIINSNEGVDHLVGSYYEGFLRRPADAAGLRGFSTLLQVGVVVNGQPMVTSDHLTFFGRARVRDEDIIAAIVGSDEYFLRL